MRVLAIESSTDMLSVAAGDATGVAERAERAGQAHAERVLPLVDEALAARGWELADVDGIAFGAGPGAFTGVRIACGIAQGLALGAGKPVVPVGTLAALAEDARRAHGATRVVACLDARMHEVYVAAYERHGDDWREAASPAVLEPAAIALPAGPWFGAGNGLAVAPSLAAVLEAADAALVPTARSVLDLARRALARGQGVAPEHALPLYVRHRVALTAAERAAGARL
ncbi:MAG: tRNA (adenosine(37)-N6)-threonylcarbamoyltransferase complex dimerization subunit type 1 TsaB [Betaproteobacteria bacterium]|nr:tRNA (adenosine(37)-N6)-threonylcarbamoyltransferase complex dimerization subunit type 1 TsaB [Betaproteobacteria bacterium]